MTYVELFRWGRDNLRNAGMEEADLDARLLLEYVCGTSRSDLLAHGDRAVDVEKQTSYEALIKRRKERVPLQHLTGVQEFMGLNFLVNEHVLIPRQDTEILVEEALKNLHDGMRILDMCTGSGCILISLLHYTNDCEGVGVDISGDALEVAQKNAEQLCGRSIRKHSFLQSDLFEKVTGKFDVIVSNPPYICSQIIGTLMPEVREHEPIGALDGGEDGLFFYRRIVGESREHLYGGGMLFFEIGYDQAGAVRNLMEQAGFLEVNVVKDYAGLDRIVYGTLGFDGAL